MNEGHLHYSCNRDAVVFTASVQEHAIAVTEWGQQLWSGGQPDCLFRLQDDGLAEIDSPYSVRVTNAAVATLSEHEVASLGLPSVPHLGLKLQSRGAVTDDDSKLELSLIRPDGVPFVGWQRDGVILRAGEERYTVIDPLHAVLQRIDRFNSSRGPDKIAAWGFLLEVLPAEATADDYLRGLRVSFASSFKLKPFLNDNGEPDFDVVPGRTIAGAIPDGSFSFEDSLPEGRAEEFAKHFRALGAPRRQYAAGAGWHVVFSEPMAGMVAALKTVQKSASDERREFLVHPHASLRAILPDEFKEQIDDVFYDIGYSDRVIGIGLWSAQVLPWVKQAAQPWLPPETLGVRIGDEYVQISPGDVGDVRELVRQAIVSGESSVEYNGHRIPASRDALEALDVLVGKRQPDPIDPPLSDPPKDDVAPRRKLVLQIGANLDEVDFAPDQRPRGPSIRQSTPVSLRTQLFPHQTEAVEWLQEHWESGSPGALLADDMGLGKTLESLAFIAWVRELISTGDYPRLPVVIVAPTGLLENWKEEATRHLDAPGLGHLVEAYGSGLRELRESAGSELQGGVPVLDTEALRLADCVLTTYETWRDYQHSFGRVRWAMGVFDEVQKIKNPGALITQSAKAINADFVLALTGTPVENRLADLWTVTDLVQPGKLGTLREFSRRYEAPDAAQASGSISELKEIMLSGRSAPMKRRLKRDHIEGLPEKSSSWPRLPMPEAQAAAYSEAVERARGAGQGGMLQALGQLRSISLHPGLVGTTSDEEYVKQSARLTGLFQILDRISEADEKALLFLESREMQSALIGLIQRRYQTRSRPMVINGAVAGKLRQERVNDFQSRSDFDVLILSPKAGGVGLTLTSANHVIHLSRWWNPAVEDQCTDRVFRIGQIKRVFVYHPIAVHPEYGDNSFDVTLDQLLQRKRAMSQAVLSPTAFSAKDFDELYHATFDRPGPSLLDEIDRFEALQFEAWVFKQLQEAGYRVESTPHSHDRGADAIAHSARGGRPVLVQIKHTQRTGALGPEPIAEIAAARNAYSVAVNPQLLVVTNASAFTQSARNLAKDEGVRLIMRDQLLQLHHWSL